MLLSCNADDEASNRSIRGTQSYLFGVTFVVGGIFGMLLSHIVRRFRRFLKSRKSQASSEDPGTSTDKCGQNATYDCLDLTKMNCEDNYQSLRMDLSGKDKDTYEHAEPYAELNKLEIMVNNIKLLNKKKNYYFLFSRDFLYNYLDRQETSRNILFCCVF